MYYLTTVRGAPPNDPEKSRNRTRSVRPTDAGGHGSRTPVGVDALEGVDQFGELDFRRVVHEQVGVVLFSVELLEFGLEVGAELPHDFSVRVSMASANAFRRYFVTKIK
jgi:hypothetical protein